MNDFIGSPLFFLLGGLCLLLVVGGVVLVVVVVIVKSQQRPMPDDSHRRPGTIRCRQCQAINDETAHFCNRCGSPIGPEQQGGTGGIKQL